MPEKRMLIMPADLVKKIDENRGDMSQAEFIDFLIDNQLKQVSENERYVTRETFYDFEQDIKDLLKHVSKDERYVTKDTLLEFEQGVKDLMRNFLEFVVSYGLELGKHPAKGDLEDLSQKLKGVGKPFQVPEEEEASETKRK
jgi:hypothetical protein